MEFSILPGIWSTGNIRGGPVWFLGVQSWYWVEVITLVDDVISALTPSPVVQFSQRCLSEDDGGCRESAENKGGAEGPKIKNREALHTESPHEDDDTGLRKMRTRV